MAIFSERPTRRTVLKAGVVAATIPAVHASANAPEDSGDKLNLGIIGVGGRGRANTAGVAGENIYALCDVHQEPIEAAKQQFTDAKTFHDWRELIEDPAIDGVVISTADHHHALAAVAAMRAGKHVYCEKPLAHTVYEARLLQDVYNELRPGIATQMGTQIHATENYRRVVALVQGGAVGPVSEVHVWCSRTIPTVEVAILPEQPEPDSFHWDVWLGPAAARSYNEQYFQGGNLNWNRRWDFGNGVLGDMGSHLIDLPFWALDLRRPLTVESVGPEVDPVACPPWQVVTWEHAPRNGNLNLATPVKVVWYHGPEGMRQRSDLLQPLVGEDTKIDDWGIGAAFLGEKGVVVADYGKYVLSPAAQFDGYVPRAATIPPSPGHYQEWIKACKTGGDTLCNFDYSGALIEHNLLGNVAHRVGKKLEWNAESFSAVNTNEAEQFLTKEYRSGGPAHTGS